MTENKRFCISSDNNQNIYDNVLKCYYSSIDAKRVCELLNELNDENKELKADNKRMVKFIMSKGYNLKDYLNWIKEGIWND